LMFASYHSQPIAAMCCWFAGAQPTSCTIIIAASSS